MSTFAEMKNIKDKVYALLETKPTLRDCDNKLICSIYVLELGRKQVDKISAMELLTKIANSELPSFESVSRVRRKLQEEFPNLRGEKYKQRQKEAQEVKDNIKKL
jgi:hypothetical protein